MTKVSRSWTGPLLFSLACAIASLACAIFPFYVIRPFRHQGSQELAAALFVKQIGPDLAIGCAVLGIAAAGLAWSSSRNRLPRGAAVLFGLLAIAGACLARVNIYEHMFHPIGAAQFESAEKVKVDSDDMVIAVQVNGVRRAYPIREMAYHHVVNDTLAGEPIVATY